MGFENTDFDFDIFYKKENLPVINPGDKVRVTIFLELPKEAKELSLIHI